MTEEQRIAAEWWQAKSGSPSGERYAAMIRAGGEGYPLARGQLATIVAKGVRKGAAAGMGRPHSALREPDRYGVAKMTRKRGCKGPDVAKLSR